jgi:hypothetical protein
MQRASSVNQARVHNGYHYPRSLLTAIRSGIDFSRFVKDYDCIDCTFKKYYAVAKSFSKVTATQFRLFCERIGAPISSAPKSIKQLFNPNLIEEVFLVKEYAFDAVKLKNLIWATLQNTDIEIWLRTKVLKLEPISNTKIKVTCDGPEGTVVILAEHVFNCTYSQINQVLKGSNLLLVPLKHELAEIALIEVPEELKNVGITVMDGPFFSTMPFPPRNLHTLSHVRYTPHCSWQDEEREYMDAHEYFNKAPKKSNFPHMIRDAQRYLPIIKECRYIDSLWEVKTILPLSEVDDSRPILFRKNVGLQNLYCVMGAKIDNIYDVLDEIDSMYLSKKVG